MLDEVGEHIPITAGRCCYVCVRPTALNGYDEPPKVAPWDPCGTELALAGFLKDSDDAVSCVGDPQLAFNVHVRRMFQFSIHVYAFGRSPSHPYVISSAGPLTSRILGRHAVTRAREVAKFRHALTQWLPGRWKYKTLFEVEGYPPPQTVDDFHRSCDGQGPTLTLAVVDFGGTGRELIGGFTTAKWG